MQKQHDMQKQHNKNKQSLIVNPKHRKAWLPTG